MIAISILTAAGILILAYIFMPFMKPAKAWVTAVSGEDVSISELTAKKDSYLKAIKDIDFEYASNKINDADYRNLKNHYSLKAAEIIEKLEKMQYVDTGKNSRK